MSRAAGLLTRRSVLGAVALVLAELGLVSVARAAGPVPVIEAGREGEVLALFSPFRLEAEITPGWRLQNVAVRSTEIAAELSGPGGSRSYVVLTHRGEGARGELTRSFVIERDEASTRGPATAAADRLVSALGANDTGGFWRATAKPEAERTAKAPPRDTPVAPIAVAFASALGMWLASRRSSPAPLR